MRLFTFPASYRPYVESQLRLAVADVQRDLDCRADEDRRVRGLATIPSTFIDDSESGTLTVLVGVPEGAAEADDDAHS